MSKKEKWYQGGFKGDIKPYDTEPHAPKEYENLDDYDVRHEFGGHVRFVKSRFLREE